MSMIFKFLLFVFILVRVSILDVYSQIPTNTLPSLKTIDAGSVNVSTSNNSLNINQSSQQAIISWNSFNVGSSAKVNFNQPSASATTLNKIFDARPSQIFGQINANGKIILQNSAGIYFGPSSTLNVGSIVATTGTISNQDFLNNKFNFSRNNSTGNIVNEGILKAIDDFVALLAPNIRNEGLIFAEKGSIVLSTGDEVTLNFQNNGYLSSIVSTPSSIDSLIQNNKAIEAPGGKIILSARAISDLVSGVINQNGTINSGSQANVVVNQGGKIFLEASSIKMSSNSSTTSKAKDIGGDISIIGKEISIDNNSVIDASGNSAGNIKILSNQENLEIKNSIIRSNSQLGDAGAIALSAVKNFLILGSTIEATGTNKGGKILLGYDFAGQTLPFAQNASFDENTHINASSTNGAGGFIETSGQTLYIRSRINAGRGGQWLVDPFDLTIDATAAGLIVSAINSGSNVSLTTSTENYSSYSLTGVSGLGNINLNSPIVATGEGTLSLTAANNIYLNKIIDLSGTASSLTLNAGNTIYYASNVTTKNNQTYTAVSHQISSQSTLQSKTGNIEIIGDIYSGYNILALLGNGNYLLNDFTTLLTANSNDQVVYNPTTKTYQLIDNISSAEALIVAGGGGGGMDMGGGGGGGGVIAGTYSFGGTTINVTVGAGGSGAPAGGTNGQNSGHNFNINASSGANSTLQYEGGTLTAVGGGYGGTSYWTSPLGGQGGSGGSGGGAAGYNAGTSGKNGSGTAGQGNAGASGSGHHVSGGGGGAGAPGNTGASNGASSGGAGVENCILGSCYYWGGGGGGSGYSVTGGNGGIGGGGGGAVGTTTGGAGYNNGSAGGGGCTNCWAQTPGGNGGTNTGGGGGGGSHYNSNNKGGDGGSGIAALKYTTQSSLTLNAENGNINLPSDLRITNLNSFKIIQKTNTPNITFTNLNLINSSFELKNQNLKVSTLSVDSTSSITTPTNQFSSLEVTGTSSIGGSISTALTSFEKNDSATGKVEKWGQYYGDLITLTGNASFNSEGKDIHFNGIQGDYNLTVSATITCGQNNTICGGWVVFNGKVGDAPFVETNATVVALNGTETAYHSNYDYLNFRSKSTLNVKSISVNADEIYIRADIITSLTQTYNGHVNIGDNGTNGTTRSLISIDPEIRFIGKSLPERDGNKYKESDFKYSFDDESITPTHSLILIAKGYCYVPSLVCGEVGNIRLAYNVSGETVYYNAIRPLKSLSTNNKTMLFPDRDYFVGVVINFNSIPKGTIDGETAVNPEGISGLPVSFEQFLNPTFFEGVNKQAELRKMVGEKVSSYLQNNNFSKSLREVSFKAYTGEVIIGGVRADFNDNTTFGFSINTDKSAGSKNIKNENKNSKIEDKNTKIDDKKTQKEECKDKQTDNCI